MNMELSSKEKIIILTSLSAITRSGGGSAQNTLLLKLGKMWPEEYEAIQEHPEFVVAAQMDALYELDLR